VVLDFLPDGLGKHVCVGVLYQAELGVWERGTLERPGRFWMRF